MLIKVKFDVLLELLSLDKTIERDKRYRPDERDHRDERRNGGEVVAQIDGGGFEDLDDHNAEQKMNEQNEDRRDKPELIIQRTLLPEQMRSIDET